MTDGEGQSPRFFYGLRPRWLSSDRLYRVYVSDRMLAGAYIAGQFYDEPSAALQLQLLGAFLRTLVRRHLAQRRKREATYDALDPFGPAVLAHDARNFQLLRSDVARTRFRRNRSLWAPLSVGMVELELHEGKTRRLVLVGNQDPDAVLRLMQEFDPAIEVMGKPPARPRPKPMSPAGRRAVFLLLAGFLLGFGALFGYAASAGVARGPALWPLAVGNVLLGGWYLVQAWRVSANPRESEALRTTSEPLASASEPPASAGGGLGA